jgi:hypothetical protein
MKRLGLLLLCAALPVARPPNSVAAIDLTVADVEHETSFFVVGLGFQPGRAGRVALGGERVELSAFPVAREQ